MQATIIMTYRAGTTPERHDNLMTILRWLSQWPQHDVIVVEQDQLPTLTESLPHPAARSLFAYNPGPFNKSWGFNVGVRQSTQPVLAFCDADLILPLGDLLDRAIVHCTNRYQVVKPYRRIIDLNPEQSVLLRQAPTEFVPPAGDGRSREAVGEYIVLCGGIFIIRAQAFRHLGGWDERFCGWGGEDDALSHLVQRARLATLEMDEQPALHLWHPRPKEQTFGQPHYAQNRALAARYPLYNDSELQRLAEVSRQAIGNPHKYRPLTA